MGSYWELTSLIKAPPLTRILVLLASMFRKSNTKFSISEAGQVPGSIIWEPLVQADVVPRRKFRGYKNALSQLNRNNIARLESALKRQHTMVKQSSSITTSSERKLTANHRAERRDAIGDQRSFSFRKCFD